MMAASDWSEAQDASWEKDKALCALLDKRAELLKIQDAAARMMVKAAEVEVRSALGRLDLARQEQLLANKELDLFRVQAAHRRCLTPSPQLIINQMQGGTDLDVHLDEVLAQGLDAQLAAATAVAALRRAALNELEEASLKQQRQQDEALESLQRRLVNLEEQELYWDAAHRACSSRVSGEVLPETVLLKVFRLLPLECLALTAGRVCTTWRRVSRDVSLWKEQDLELDFSLNPKQIALVREAPAWRTLYLKVSENIPPAIYWALEQREFFPSLFVELEGAVRSELFCNLLGKMSGRLGSLTVRGFQSRYESGLNRSFWEAVSTMNLRALHLQGSLRGFVKQPCSVEFSDMCLEELSVSWSGGQGNLLGHGPLPRILSASRKTLKKVDFEGCADSVIVQSLAVCPHLRVADVSLVKALRALEACTELEELEINCLMHDGARAFEADEDCTEAFEAGVNLLTSTSLSERLLRLELEYPDESFVAAACGNLPRLTSLYIIMESALPDHVLVAIFENSPLLEYLNVFPFHANALRLLIDGHSRLPQLRVLVLDEDLNSKNEAMPAAVGILRMQRPYLEIVWV